MLLARRMPGWLYQVQPALLSKWGKHSTDWGCLQHLSAPGQHPKNWGGWREWDLLHLLCWAALEHPGKRTGRGHGFRTQGITCLYINAIKNHQSRLMNFYCKQKFLHSFLSQWQQCVYLWGWKEQKFALRPTAKSLDKFSGAENCIWARL